MFILCRYTVPVTTSWNTGGTVYGTPDKSYRNDLCQRDHPPHHLIMDHFHLDCYRKRREARNGLSRLRMALRKIRSPLRIVLCITALINAVASSASAFTLIWSVLYLTCSGFMCIARLYCLCKGLDAAKWTQALVITSILALVYMLQKLQRPRRNPSVAAPACEQIVPCIVDAA